MRYKIVETDNHDGDYPDEKFVENIPVFHTSALAWQVADAINATQPSDGERFWKVVPDGYQLVGGFEP